MRSLNSFMTAMPVGPSVVYTPTTWPLACVYLSRAETALALTHTNRVSTVLPSNSYGRARDGERAGACAPSG